MHKPGDILRFRYDGGHLNLLVLSGMTVEVVSCDNAPSGITRYLVRSVHGAPTFHAYGDELVSIEEHDNA